MISKVSYKKFFIATVLMLSVSIVKSQVRTDGYYASNGIGKTVDTTFHILCFTTNGFWTDTSGTGVAPGLINAPAGNNNVSYTYSRSGNGIKLTYESISLPQYHVSNCPCKYRIRIEDDGIFVIDWRGNHKNRTNIKMKYLFVPFRNNN